MTVHVGIVGCGRIFPRHIEAIEKTETHLEAVCDINRKLANEMGKKYNVPAFYHHREMLEYLQGVGKGKNMVTIATPNDTHFSIAMDSLNAGQHVLLEKPVCLSSRQLKTIIETSEKVRRNAFAVLQVRFNPTIEPLRQALKESLLGDIKFVSLIQRWQRPDSYYDMWYTDPKISGGVLFEVGIHYMDILTLFFGVPSVLATEEFDHKKMFIDDTVYSILKFRNGASGSLEITTAAEPTNLECSISIVGNKGYIKVGGRALERFETALFSSDEDRIRWENMTKDMRLAEPNHYKDHVGSCPNHPSVYDAIAKSKGIKVSESLPVLRFIEKVYEM